MLELKVSITDSNGVLLEHFVVKVKNRYLSDIEVAGKIADVIHDNFETEDAPV